MNRQRMQAVGEWSRWRKVPAAAAVKGGGAEQGCAVIDGDYRISRGGALQQRFGVICGIAAAKRTLNAADIIGHGSDSRCRWRSNIDGQGEALRRKAGVTRRIGSNGGKSVSALDKRRGGRIRPLTVAVG